MRPAMATALLAILVSHADARLLRFGVTHSTYDSYVVNDLSIDFDERLFGQQLVVELTSGSIYQDPVGGETPPNAAFFSVFPSLEWDTFVSIGGLTTADALDILTVGGSTELELSGATKEFDEHGIDIAWAPAPGVEIDGGADFPVARLTLSGDASGRFQFFSNSGGVPAAIENGVIVGGRFDFLIDSHNHPEPAASLLAVWGFAAAAGRRRDSRD